MEINKIIKIVHMNKPFEVKIRNILEVEKKDVEEYIILKYWNPDYGKKEFKYIFSDELHIWYDKDGNESTDYKKLVDTLSVYAEQTQLKDAIAYLN